MNNEEKNTQQESTHTSGEKEGKTTEKTFTQEEVNAIISERLTRERAKSNNGSDERERALKSREAALACREYILEKGLSSDFLDVLNTNNLEEFKTSIEKLEKIMSQNLPVSTVTVSTGMSHESTLNHDTFAEAFKPKI